MSAIRTPLTITTLWLIKSWFVISASANFRMALSGQLPVVPVFQDNIRESETASCQACGGGIEYDAGDFACICSYCNVENFRVRFVSRALALAEKQKTRTKSVLFGAMEIIEDFIGTFFFVLLMLVGASTLLTVFYAIKNLL